MGKVILMASGKGGVGKTTLCANIAACLAGFGKKVLLLDADIRLRNLDICLGLCNAGLFDIQDLCLGRCDHETAVVVHELYPHLHFVPGPGRLTVSPDDLMDFIGKYATEQAKDYDFVFIDCPSGIEDSLIKIFHPGVFMLLVANPDAASVRDAERTAEIAYAKKVESRLIVNRIRPALMKKGQAPDVDDIIDNSCVRLIGIVPEDIRITVNAPNGVLLRQLRKARSLRAVENIAMRLCGEQVPLYIFK